jgi:hypothetical protein
MAKIPYPLFVRSVNEFRRPGEMARTRKRGGGGRPLRPLIEQSSIDTDAETRLVYADSDHVFRRVRVRQALLTTRKLDP